MFETYEITPDRYVEEHGMRRESYMIVYKGYICEVAKLSLEVRQEEMLEWYCGYVFIPPTHPYYLINQWELDGNELKVHGGVTHVGYNIHNNFEESDIWVIGFDCTHDQDNIEIQNEKYIEEQLKQLVEQLIERENTK